MTKEAAEALVSVIKNNSNLERLYLANNDLKTSAVLILLALKNNSKLKVLDLNSNNMTGEAAEALASVIKNNSNLEQLSLASNGLKASAVLILQALKETCRLQHLDLDDNSMTGKAAVALASVIKNNSNLEQLGLASNDLKSSTVLILLALKSHSKLNILNLNGNNMTGEAAEALATVIKNNSNLEQLGLASNDLKSSTVLILQALKENSKLKVLNLNSNSITEEAAENFPTVIENNSNLKQLYLSHNNFKTSAILILQALKNIKHLKILALSSNFMSHDIFTELTATEFISNNPLITELWLSGNMLQNRVIDIAISCNSLKNLQVLELSYNSVSPTYVLHLASLVANTSILQVLMFSGLVLNINERFSASVVQFYDASKKKFVLQKSKNKFNENTKPEFSYLEVWRFQFAGRIQSCYDYKNYFPTSITTMQVTPIYMEQNLSTVLSVSKLLQHKLSQLNATKIINSLSNIIKMLKMLDLGYSNINSEAVVELATTLNCNNVLEQLWLKNNVLGPDGADVVLTSLQNITTLRVLDLSYNNISSTSANGIAAVINSNHFLEQLWLDGNMLRPQVL